MKLSSTRRLFGFALLAVVASIAAACSSDADPTPFPTCEGNPFAFPHIYGGSFTVDGEPGPQGVPMFATLGGCRGAFNESLRPGEYINVTISGQTDDDFGGEINFYLGHPDGPFVKADQTAVYERTTQPQFYELDLSFPESP